MICGFICVIICRIFLLFDSLCDFYLTGESLGMVCVDVVWKCFVNRISSEDEAVGSCGWSGLQIGSSSLVSRNFSSSLSSSAVSAMSKRSSGGRRPVLHRLRAS